MPLSENKQRWLAAHPELGRLQSMKRRHDHHDYQSPCIYLITLAIKGRMCRNFDTPSLFHLFAIGVAGKSTVE